MVLSQVQLSILRQFNIEKADQALKQKFLSSFEELSQQIVIDFIISNLDENNKAVFIDLLLENSDENALAFAKNNIPSFEEQLQKRVLNEISTLSKDFKTQ